MLKNFKRVGFFIALLLFISCAAAFSEDDGFGAARKIESEHFTVYIAPGIDTDRLAQSLNPSPQESILTGRPHGGDLQGLVDVLFSRVCDILDMQLYSFHGTIKVCGDFQHLNSIYNNLFDRDLTNKYSFYVYNLNTVYICAEHFSREVLGHEIAHAIISHYFVVLPSVKIQEVLAMFVEYNLRKL